MHRYCPPVENLVFGFYFRPTYCNMTENKKYFLRTSSRDNILTKLVVGLLELRTCKLYSVMQEK